MEDNTKTNGTTEQVDTQGQETTNVDYQAEYNKTLLELEKVREALKKTNSENAEYKREKRESMSAEQQKAQDLKDLIESKKALEQELAQIKLEKSFVAQGFTVEEIQDLNDNSFSAESIKKLIDARVKVALENDNLRKVKETTSKQSMTSGNSGKEETRAERLAKKTNQSNSQAIKDQYK